MTDRLLSNAARKSDVRRDNRGGLQLFIPESELATVADALSVSDTAYPKWLAEQVRKYAKAATAAPVA